MRAIDGQLSKFSCTRPAPCIAPPRPLYSPAPPLYSPAPPRADWLWTQRRQQLHFVSGHSVLRYYIAQFMALARQMLLWVASWQKRAGKQLLVEFVKGAIVSVNRWIMNGVSVWTEMTWNGFTLNETVLWYKDTSRLSVRLLHNSFFVQKTPPGKELITQNRFWTSLSHTSWRGNTL